MGSKKLLKDVADMTGKRQPLDFEMLSGFLDVCTKIDLKYSESTQLLFLAFQAYVLKRLGRITMSFPVFKRALRVSLQIDDERSTSEIEGMHIIWKNIETSKEES